MSEYDLFSATFKADPFPTFAALRCDAPVYAHRTPSGQTIWYVSRYEDGVAVLRDHDLFIKDMHALRERPSADSPHELHAAINRNMLFADPPDHTRLRALVSLAFTPRRIEALQGRVQEIADALIDAVVARGKCDLMAAFALPLPVQVIGELLGIPSADRERVAAWSQVIISPVARRLSKRERRRTLQAFVAWLHTLFADRRAAPRDDLISALVQAEQAGDRLTEAQLSSMVALLLVTGHETTVHLIGNGMLALLTHPQQRALLQAQPALIDQAIEELLRFDGPVESSTTRWVARDEFWNGAAMRRGDVVRVLLTSADRDPARFPDPDRLDLTRSDSRHLQFGLGIHYCLGAPLARLEARTAFLTLLRRLPDLQLAVPAADLQWRPGVLFRGLVTLPVVWK
jgi:cytochrome P450